MKNILFRADSSSTIGTGHIMRDLVLAAQFEGENILFATQDLPGNINHTIKASGFDIELLQSNDLDELIGLIKCYSIDLVVIDHYKIDYEFEKELKERADIKLLVLDDTYEKHHCDILLNHNIYADPLRYRRLVPNNCEIRCGAEYTLLREEFRIERCEKRSYHLEVESIMIAMGGADTENKNIDILKIIECFPSIHTHVVTTTANKHLIALYKYAEKRENITIHLNTDCMAKLMNKVDLAILTPSVIVNEAAYMRLPFIAIKTADNQSKMCEYLMRNGYLAMGTFDVEVFKDKLGQLIEALKIEPVRLNSI
ncbi:MAG: UDP-2,4-diacetamido-2,4,6-trideoxy-beta-L-altropyranose hydrolase [Ghiorsea sp.]|nr:UDP-2,4-diacetamido-2,4,6-trideoxy-beta-L-altropyranose hydrolase [Ghiorsea sp.]